MDRPMTSPITDYTDTYVTACGLALPNAKLGADHERLCEVCKKLTGRVDRADVEVQPGRDDE